MLSSKLYTNGALGGTFDHFHDGHRQFLRFAATQAEHLLIGITDTSLTQNKQFARLIQSYDIRVQAVTDFLDEMGTSFEIISLHNAFGPTLGEREIECLIVTELTVDGGDAINQARSSKGLAKLPVQVCTMVKDESGEILNSTRIRSGQVSRSGLVYRQIFQHNITVTEQHKELLRVPWGAVIVEPSDSKENRRVVVGDRSLANFIEQQWRYDLGIFDLVEQRQHASTASLVGIQPQFTVNNPAGTIQSAAVDVLKEWINHSSPKTTHIRVNGEEDLLVVPLILLVPLETDIYYGQPHVGMIEVKVTEELKQQMYDVFSHT